MKEKFNIEGMGCAACAGRIEKEVQKLTFVKKVSVNLLENSMTVEFEGNNIKKIINTVNNIGYKASIKNEKNIDEFKILKRKTILSFIFAIPLFYLSMGRMFDFPYPEYLINNPIISSLIQFFLVIPIIVVNFSYFKKGIKALISFNPDMNSLVSVGAISSFLWGCYILFGFDSDLVSNSNHFFESAGMILTFVGFGKTLEAKAKAKTTNSISGLTELKNEFSNLIKDGIEKRVPTKEIKKGDIIRIKEGENIPCDGTIIKGTGLIDESFLTGESLPVSKKEKNGVYSGTINKLGVFDIVVQNEENETLLSKIIELTENSIENKAPIQRFADKISRIFTPAILIISFLTFIFWLVFGKDFNTALMFGVSTLVISCPCALGLATPVVVSVAIGVGARMGILFKSAEILEKMGSIDVVVFDKTGTLTKGTIKVKEIFEDKLKKDEILKISASIEQFSTHPYSLAIKNEIQPPYFEVSDFETKQGEGLKGKINGKNYYIGNKNYLKSFNIDSNLENFRGVYLFDDKEVLGRILFSDEIREESKDVVAKLKKMNIETIMLTGDNELTAREISNQTGIKEVIFEVLPNEKNRKIKKLKALNKKVLMVGDGINDAPALAEADIGVSIGRGSDIAIESSDVVLLNDNLFNLVNSILLSREAVKNIKLNLFWALFYNVLCIPIAMGVLSPFNIRLTPDISAFLMSISSLFVVLNALRLNLYKPYK